MATEGKNLTDGGNWIAAADYSTTGQFYAVKQSTAADRTVTLATTGGEAIVGILGNAPKSGEAAEVIMVGLTKALIGTGGVTRGQKLQVENATGKLITYASGSAVGWALESAAAGVIAAVMLVPVVA